MIDPEKTPAENFADHYGPSATGGNLPEPNALSETDRAVLRAALLVIERLVGR